MGLGVIYTPVVGFGLVRLGRITLMNLYGRSLPYHEIHYIASVLSSGVILLAYAQFGLVCIILSPCQYDNGYLDGRSQI